MNQHILLKSADFSTGLQGVYIIESSWELLYRIRELHAVDTYALYLMKTNMQEIHV